MGFTLRELLTPAVVTVVERQSALQYPERLSACPTGKTAFESKAIADRELARINQTQRTNMRRFRCGYCAQYHLGHRRGAIY